MTFTNERSRGYRMQIFRRLALTGALFGAAACNADRLNIPNYNSPTVPGLQSDPAGLQLLATGLLRSSRNGHRQVVSDFGIFGRESYFYFPTDGRTITDYLRGLSSPPRLERAGFASGGWFNRYQAMRNAVSLITAANASTLPAAQKKAATGFAKTMRALDLLYVIVGRDSLGAPVEIKDDFSQAPFVSRDSVYKFITALLDDAKADLAAGSTFPFTLHAGFAGFNTPAGFLKFNRGLKARTDVYRATLGCGSPCYQSALTALGESWVTAVGAAASLADLNNGVSHVYSSGPGDAVNSLSFAVDNQLFAHASIVSDAQLKADGKPDDRLVRKVVANAAPVPANGNNNIPATQHFIMYASSDTPTPIMRNEELILLRAEANLGAGNVALALQDINNIRAVSGGLAPLASLPATPLDAVMYERRYSLLWEGLRWVDMRRWGRLNLLPLDRPDQFVAKVMPIPQPECDARPDPKPNGCNANQ